MSDHILILEQDVQDPTVWSYGLADDEGQLPAEPYLLRHDPAHGCMPVGQHHAGLWPTVVLLVRSAGTRARIVYDLTLRPAERPEPPSRSPEERWERATRAKAQGPGETLRQRAERDRRPRRI